ncbi:MAG: PAS domain S-box protein, partial [Calditrichales bacterium]|nr:PAS domain S-box protein [Calditrichales bacterium]
FVISISAPLFVRDEFSGVLIVNFSVEQYLYKLLTNRSGLGKTGGTYLVNKERYLISPVLFMDDAVFKIKINTEQINWCFSEHLEKELPETIGHKPTKYQNYRGNEVLGVHYYIPEMQWALIAEIDIKEANETLNKLTFLLILFFSFLLIVVLIAAILISNTISLPIKKLQKRTEDIIKGNLNSKVGLKTDDEIGELSRSFDIMTGKLREAQNKVKNYTEDLESQVQKRTAELQKTTENLADEISERKQSNEALQESEGKFRSISATAQDAIIMTDNNGNVTYWNNSAERIFGFTEEAAFGKEIHKLIVPQRYHKKAEKGFASFKKSGAGPAIGKTLELEAQRKDGTEFPVELSISGFKIKGEWHAAAMIRDITVREQNEQEIAEHRGNLEGLVKERTAELEEIAKEMDESQQSLAYLLEDVNESRDELEEKSSQLNISLKDAQDARDKIDAILKSVGDGLIVTDNNNRVILINHIAEDLFKVSLKDVVNRSIDYAIKDKTLRERVKYTLNKRIDYQFDFELPGENLDKPLIFQARTSVIKDKEGKANGIITIFHDVSHEREVDRMKTEFISTAAHELRTPLTSIQGFSEILLTRENLDKIEKDKFLNYINKQAENLAAIIGDLLDISRIESGTSFILEKSPCIFCQVIKDTVEPFISQSKIHMFDINIPKKPIEILIDSEKIAQVLKNLISNAIKYSPDGGVIQVSGAVKEDVYQVSVEDEGMGMNPEQVSKIYDKFYRADTSNTAIEGTGLGMGIVKYIVEAHGGKVWVESKFGKGTKVTFTIPLK